MTPAEFVAKWRHVELTERSSAQTHFTDLCRLVDHKDPVSADPQGVWFTFERGATKAAGGEGWADVWKKGYFGWEYKSKTRDLDAAYLQLLRYQGALENPPLLVTCDTDRIVIHTHFVNTPTRIVELTLDGLVEPEHLATLRAVFHDPERLRPDQTIQSITEEAALKITEVAQALRGRGLPPERVARFLDRVVFCLFAEDVGLLPDKVFTRVVQNTQRHPDQFQQLAADLFTQMAGGGHFGADRIEHFNGNLFDATEALAITVNELKGLLEVSALDWSNIDASIFGTLFERALDPDKRSQLGAHYTSRDDIELLVDPVVMAPLRREWTTVRGKFDALVTGLPTAKQWKDARALVRGYLDRLATVTVLDPACGSGNFLFVTLQRLKDLEKEVIIHASAFFPFFPQVGPWQLRGIEVNAYAHDLAQMTAWIGHLQWHERHGMPLSERPILRTMDNFERKDAILAVDGTVVSEPSWPEAEFIVSNPPFLGVRRLRDALGDDYVEALFGMWGDRVPSGSDYCCYWFEKSRAQVAAGKTRRVGLLATQGIRGGGSREVLRRIKDTGSIFFAVSSREWVLDGANVNVSLVGFDDGTETSRQLDGEPVASINPDLTTTVDLTASHRLRAARRVSFMADTKGGAFDIPIDVAADWLHQPNPHGRPNSDVLRPWANGLDVTRRPRDRWIIDFPAGTTSAAAARFERVFEYLRANVYEERRAHRSPALARDWWLHERPRPDMRAALAPLPRFIATLALGKHRSFVWMKAPTLPDHQLIVFALSDDESLGLLQSRIHEVWALRQGSRQQTRPRYTPTSTFETFPFPEWSSSSREAVGSAARELDTLRTRWLNPPEFVREESLSFRASLDGPWGHLVESPDEGGIGNATHRWQVPVDEDAAKALRKRTLTELANTTPTWLADVRRSLDEAAFAAYGWDPGIGESELLQRLLDLNRERHALESAAGQAT